MAEADLAAVRVTASGVDHSSRRWLAAWTVAVVVTTAFILWLMGQPPRCKCGDWSPWSWDIWSAHNSQHLIDPYTFTHVLHGLILCGLIYWLPRSVSDGIRFLAAVVIEAGWELLENSPLIIQRYRETTISQDYFRDSIANSAGDILACIVGYGIALRLRTVRSLMFFAATEFILAITIRDGLILNVLMLVFPIESIRQWQIGR